MSTSNKPLYPGFSIPSQLNHIKLVISQCKGNKKLESEYIQGY